MRHAFVPVAVALGMLVYKAVMSRALVICRHVLAMVVLASPFLAHAQYRIDEIVAKGGQAMTAAELRAELSGKYVTGHLESGAYFEVRLMPGGKMEGMSSSRNSRSELIGTWRVTDKNQFCADGHLVQWNLQSKRCQWWWKVGTEYFATSSHLDDDAAARFVDCLLSSALCQGDFHLMKRDVRP
jgi:hypothetical protein